MAKNEITKAIEKTGKKIQKGIVKNPREKDLKPETKKEIIEDIKETGIPEKIAKAEEKLDEKEQKIKPEEKSPEEVKEEDEKVEEKKTPTQKKPKIKKTTSVVNARDIPISTKQSIAICKFILNKRIGDAIRDLKEVSKLKKAVPMKGEIPHRKGKMSSGRYPKKASESFIILLKSLAGNSSEMDNPVIREAVANMGPRPLGRFGRMKKKRTHIRLVAKEKKEKLNKERKNGEK